MDDNDNQLPDSPCLGFCTTALGDDVCKRCHRTFEEVTAWITMVPDQKKKVWDRINENGWWFDQRARRDADVKQRRQQAQSINNEKITSSDYGDLTDEDIMSPGM